jgi:gliding motility-associated-like protein
MIGKKVGQLRLVVLTVSMLLIQFVAKSQIEVGVPFDDGFIGLVGSNSNTSTNIQRFATLGIAKVSFVQTTYSGKFEFTQGNDVVVPADIVTTLVLTGLNDATAYSLSIGAVNSIGYGTKSSAVNATPISVPASSLTIDPIASQTYTGSALTPSIVVKDGSTTLTLGTHYTVAYSNNTNVGTASVMITGMGNYTGTKTGTFSIFIPGPTAVVCCSDLAGTYAFDALQTFCGKPPYSGSITLTAVATSPGSYTVSDGSFGSWANCYPDTWGNGNVRINDNCGNLTMSGRDKYGDSYSMTVKSITPALLTFEWRNTYGEFGIVALKSNAGKPWPIPGIIKATSSLTIDAIANQTFTGSALTPAVVVKDGATILTLGTHYSVAYTNNRNVGIATVTITGKGNYTCSKSKTFSIVDIAPSALSYTTPNVFIKDIAITPLSPTYTGTVTSFTVSPSLPAGLSINATTGVISGTLTAQQTGTVVYTITATNSGGSTTATVTLIYIAAPTDVTLSSTAVVENAASGISIATLSATDSDAGDTFTYTLVSGTGSTDNASFTIDGTTFKTASVFDFETKSSYSVRVRVTDAGGLSFERSFTITVTDVNEAPTNISASASSVLENAALGTSVATMSATDVDAGDTFTFALVSGTGSTDNASFSIAGNALRTAGVFDFETKNSYSVRVRVTDAGGLSFERSFTITVTDVNEAPINISLSANIVAENVASGTAVGTLAATDVDAGDTFTYTLVSGTGDTDNASFTIDGTTFKTASVFDFETKSSYVVRVRVTDAGGLSFERAFTITVTNVNEAPTNISASASSILENAALGTSVATMSATDVDAGDTFTYTLVSGTGSTDNASFTIAGSTLSTAAVFDFETKNSYSVRIRVTDAGGLSFERAFTITVIDVNEAPTLTAITDRRVYNVSTSQIVNLAGITAGPETAQTTSTNVSTSNPTAFSAINIVGTQIQFTLAAGIVTPQDVVVTVRVKDNGGIANGGVDSVVRTFRLGIDPMPVAAASPNLITLGTTAQLNATGANALNYTWLAVGGTGIVGSGATINVRPAVTTTYAVVVNNSFGYQATVPVLLTVIVDYKLVPNNLVTPNGDGVNDKWVIPNIDMYPDNEVIVYDKAGRSVFTKRGYNNEWDGTLNGTKLKEDAYFYVIKFNKDGALPIRGYVSIVR